MAQSARPADTDVIDSPEVREQVLAFVMFGDIMGVPPIAAAAAAADVRYRETGVPMDLNPSARRSIRDGIVSGRIVL